MAEGLAAMGAGRLIRKGKPARMPTTGTVQAPSCTRPSPVTFQQAADCPRPSGGSTVST